MRKIAGQCTLCDDPCFAVETTHPEGHPYAGQPNRLGAVTPDAMRLTFALTDGSSVDLTFCEGCSEKANDNLPEIWQRCLAAQAYEIDNIENITKAKRTATELYQVRALNMKLAHIIPLGVLYSRRWTEIR